MDTKKLVVGQKIQMQSGSLLREATVIEITDEYIAAKPVCFEQNERPWMIHFQKDGKQFSVQELVARTGSGNIDWKCLGNLGAYELFSGKWGRPDPFPLSGEAGWPWELNFGD